MPKPQAPPPPPPAPLPVREDVQQGTTDAAAMANRRKGIRSTILGQAAQPKTILGQVPQGQSMP